MLQHRHHYWEGSKSYLTLFTLEFALQFVPGISFSLTLVAEFSFVQKPSITSINAFTVRVICTRFLRDVDRLRHLCCVSYQRDERLLCHGPCSSNSCQKIPRPIFERNFGGSTTEALEKKGCLRRRQSWKLLICSDFCRELFLTLFSLTYIEYAEVIGNEEARRTLSGLTFDVFELP